MSNKGKETLDTKSEMRFFVVVSACLLVGGFLAGALFPSSFTDVLRGPIRQLALIVHDTKMHHSTWYIFWTILSHNVWVAVTLLVLGFAFGLWPAWAMWTNGLLTGFVVSLGAQEQHVAIWKMVVFGILPHGIFELSAFVMAAGIGMSNGYAVARTILPRLGFASRASSQGPQNSSPRHMQVALVRTARGFLWTLGMLVVAAGIEAFITPHLLLWGLHHAIRV